MFGKEMSYLIIFLLIVNLQCHFSLGDKRTEVIMLQPGLIDMEAASLPFEESFEISNIDYSYVLTPSFDSIMQRGSTKDAVEYCVKILIDHLKQVNFDINAQSMLVSSSRGACCMLEAMQRFQWRGTSLFISPIIIGSNNFEEDDYDEMVNFLVHSEVPSYIAMGNSIDEELVILDPISEALSHKNLLYPKLRQFDGDHDWWHMPSNLRHLLSHVVEEQFT